MGSGILESAVWSLGSGLWRLESGVCNLESGVWNLGPGRWSLSLESGIWSLESGVWDLSIWKHNVAKSIVKHKEKNRSCVKTQILCESGEGEINFDYENRRNLLAGSVTGCWLESPALLATP